MAVDSNSISPSRCDSGESAGNTSLLLWAGLAAAFSPTILDLFRHWSEEPWSRYVLVFPVLFAVCARREPRAERGRAGLHWIAVGLALEIVAAFHGAIRWARPGLALAAIGLCQRSGFGSPRDRVLLLFAVPAPAFAVHAGYAVLDTALLEPIASCRVHRGALALAPLLAGLAWYEAALCRRPLGRALAASGAAALTAVPIAALASFASCCAAASGLTRAAQWLAGPALWIPLTAVAIAIAEWRWRRRARAWR
jgi:hypothetical protein